MNKKLAFILALITISLASRFIPHYPNFTAIGSMAILGGAMLRKPIEALLLTLGALFVSDIILNNVLYTAESFTLFYEGAVYVYGAVALSVVIGSLVKKLNIKNYFGLSIISSAIFFLATNYGVWATGFIYPDTTQGLMAAYAAAIPYGLSHLAGTLIYGVAIMAAFRAIAKVNDVEFAKI